MRRGICIVLSAVALLAGCEKEEDAFADQQKRIVSYLTGAHDPHLLSEADAAVSLDENPPFYTEHGRSAYRYIDGFYAPGRTDRTEVARGDSLDLTFAAFVFTSGSPRLGDCYFSNDAEIIGAMVEAGLNPALWLTEEDEPRPLRVKLGDGRLLEGVERALVGCREGDAVEVFMTYNLAYGDTALGVIPAQSAVAFYCVINEVRK